MRKKVSDLLTKFKTGTATEKETIDELFNLVGIIPAKENSLRRVKK
jgi:hypothetical protein